MMKKLSHRDFATVFADWSFADRLCKPGEVIHDDEDVLLFFFDFDVEKIDGNEF